MDEQEKSTCGHYTRFRFNETDTESVCAACEIDRICSEYSELEKRFDRMRKALEDARKWLYASELIAVKPLISDLDRALNPQPAPPEKE